MSNKSEYKVVRNVSCEQVFYVDAETATEAQRLVDDGVEQYSTNLNPYKYSKSKASLVDEL